MASPPPIMHLDEDQQRLLQETSRNTNSTRESPSQRLGSGDDDSYSEPMSPPHVLPRPTRFTLGQSSALRSVLNDQRNADANTATRPSQHSDATFMRSSSRSELTSRTLAGAYDPSEAYWYDIAMLDRLDDDDGSDDVDAVAGLEHAPSKSRNARVSVTYNLIGIGLGITIGIAAALLEVSPLVSLWIGVPGDLFLRALNALIIPYIFCTVAIAIGDIVFVGQISVVGVQTFKIFLIMWIVTAALGVSVAMLFRPMFQNDRAFDRAPANAVSFTCASTNKLLALQSDGSLHCHTLTGNDTTSNDTTMSTVLHHVSGDVANGAAFAIVDVNDAFQKNAKRALALTTVSDQIIANLNHMVPKNIFETLRNGDFISTMTFAMVFGAVAGHNYFAQTRRINYLYLTMLQLRNAFALVIKWTLRLTPVAVLSIIAGSFAKSQSALVQEFALVSRYVLAILAAAVLQMLVTQPAIFFLLARCNPFAQMKHMVRAYIFAFAVGSSLATAPVTLACIKKARMSSQPLVNFVVSIGACCNLTAMGFYYPIGIVWLAETSGKGDELTSWRLLTLFLLSVLACAGTPPVPQSGIAIMATVYKTVFGVSVLPETFPLYMAVDFFIDRISSVVDVNDDMLVVKVIAENTDETIAGDCLGERETVLGHSDNWIAARSSLTNSQHSNSP